MLLFTEGKKTRLTSILLLGFLLQFIKLKIIHRQFFKRNIDRHDGYN